MNAQTISRFSIDEIYSLKAIPSIMDSRIVENVSTRDADVRKFKPHEVDMSYGLTKTKEYVNNSAKVYNVLSCSLNWKSRILEQIVKDAIEFRQKEGELEPETHQLLEERDYDMNFKNLLIKKLKYLTIYWLLGSKFTVNHEYGKYYFEYTEDRKEVEAFYNKFKTTHSEKLLGTLNREFLAFIESLDKEEDNKFSKFFERWDYSEDSFKEAEEALALLLEYWSENMKRSLDSVLFVYKKRFGAV